MLAQQREQVLEGIDGWIKNAFCGVADTPMITHRVFDEDKIKPEIDFTQSMKSKIWERWSWTHRAITKTGVNDLFSR